MTRATALAFVLALGAACSPSEQRTDVAVFDLDHTLFDNRPRTHEIVNEFARNLPPEREALGKKLRALRTDQVHYLLSDTLAELGVTDAADIEELTEFWKERFFTDAYVPIDEPLPCAVDYVRALHEEGARIVYLTGRDAPNMEQGTRASLEKHAFPLDERTQLIMKGSFDEDDLVFKSRVLASVDELGRVIAMYENEPGNLAKMSAHWSDARPYFLETDFDPRKKAPVPDSATRLSDYCDAPRP